MVSEEVLFGLVQTAQEQQETVQKATQAMATQRGELYNAIAQLKNMQASVAAEAKTAVKESVSSIGADLNASLTSEVNRTRKTIRDMTEDLHSVASWLTWRWIVAFVILGAAMGFAACWAMEGRDARDTAQRLDAIEQTLLQVQAQQPVKPQPNLHISRPKPQTEEQ
jgi:hypothetical protein